MLKGAGEKRQSITITEVFDVWAKLFCGLDICDRERANDQEPSDLLLYQKEEIDDQTK